MADRRRQDQIPAAGAGGFGQQLGGLFKDRFAEFAGTGPQRAVPPRSSGRLALLWVAAVPLFFGGLACVGLATQTINELRGPASATSPDWLLALAACFFVVMVGSLFAAGVMLVMPRRPRPILWLVTLIVGIGGAVIGGQQLAAADWRAFTNAGSGAAVFLVLSVYLVLVSGVRIWLLFRRRHADPLSEPDDDVARTVN